jgi:uncharacterized protein YjbI with pentapeptide repeats
MSTVLSGAEAYSALHQGRSLEGAVIEGDCGPPAKRQSAPIEHPVRADGAEFRGSLNLTDHRFRAPVSFRGARFLGPQLHWWRVLFEGDADFSGAEFAGNDTLFSQSEFRGAATSFREAHCRGTITNFRKVRFASRTLTFVGATFAGERTHFRETRFEGEGVDFSRARFTSSHETSFRMAEFHCGEAEFSGADFSSRLIDCNETVFAPVTRMIGCSGSGSIVFCNVDLDRLELRRTDLSRCEFRSPLRYRKKNVIGLATRRIVGDELRARPGEELDAAAVYRQIRAFYLQRSMPYEADWGDYRHHRDTKSAWEIYLSELAMLRRAKGILWPGNLVVPYAALRALLARHPPTTVGSWHVAPR